MNRWLRARLEERGLHPYRVPMACEFLPGCECCQGVVCPRACKNDAARICLEPALRRKDSRLLTETRAVRLEVQGRRVERVLCIARGRPLSVRGRVVVLAAGALETPRLLLASDGPRGRRGLANESGLVGRCLMRHLVDVYLIRAPDGLGATTRKEIAFSDLYEDAGEKLGSVQSLGSIAAALPGGGGDAPPRPLALASVLEDLPYPSNRVEPASPGRTALAIRYRVGEDDARRLARFRRRIQALLPGTRTVAVRAAEQADNLGHVCGTCRFGSDPRDSVLDADNRAHSVDNLHVVDASFFPTSAGMNPALTIAANALRVARLVDARL